MNPSLSADNDRMALALLIAGALHVLLIFGIGFDSPERDHTAGPVEVTLIVKPGQRPVDAQYKARTDQRGITEEAQRDRVAEALIALPKALPPGGMPSTRLAEAPQPSDTERELARLEARVQRLQANLGAQPRASKPVQRLDQAAANQGQSAFESPDTSRVRRLNSVAAFAAIDAAYLAEWRNRVEAIGNQYYPEASRRYGIYGSLEMLVTVRSDGGLDAIQILRSSGHAVLDEAAIRIVRASAPFAAFSTELRASTDKLEIQRTWQFEQNPLSSN